MRLRTRVRGWCDGIGGNIAVACILLFVALLGAAAISQDQSALRWTGDKVSGSSEGGIIYYTVDGENYTVTAPGPAPSQPDTPKPATVYVNPGDPTDAWPMQSIDNVTTGIFVGLPVTGAVLVVVLGIARRSFRQRKQLHLATLPPELTFGRGLDEGFVLRALANMRQSGRSLRDR